MRRPYFLIHLAKDLRIEWRSRDAINSMLFFALLVVVIFSLAFDPTRAVSRQISGPILCVAILFAAVSALNQAWARELRHSVLDAHRMNLLTRKSTDGVRPKLMRRNIRVHHANFPRAGKSSPHLMRYVSSYSTPPASTKYKKLRDIPHSLIAGDFGASLHQHQACQLAVQPDKKRMPPRLTPIKRTLFVAKPSIRSNL